LQKDPKDLKVPKVLRDLKKTKVLKVLKVLKDPKGLKVLKVLKDLIPSGVSIAALLSAQIIHPFRKTAIVDKVC